MKRKRPTWTSGKRRERLPHLKSLNTHTGFYWEIFLNQRGLQKFSRQLLRTLGKWKCSFWLQFNGYVVCNHVFCYCLMETFYLPIYPSIAITYLSYSVYESVVASLFLYLSSVYLHLFISIDLFLCISISVFSSLFPSIYYLFIYLYLFLYIYIRPSI